MISNYINRISEDIKSQSSYKEIRSMGLQGASNDEIREIVHFFKMAGWDCRVFYSDGCHIPRFVLWGNGKRGYGISN